MAIKIALDAGHGINTAGKRTPAGEREWTFNDKVVRSAIARLNEYQGVEILRTDDPTGRTDVPLKARTDKANAWKADVFVSAHHNAHQGVWGSHGGVETYVHPTGSRASYAIADILQTRIVKAMGLRNRGVKQANLHIVRESDMPGILTEGGFMDSTTDIGALRSDARLKAQGEAVADGLASYFKLKRKVSKPAESLYRVRKTWADAKTQKGAFASLDNAKALANKNAGYSVFDAKGTKVAGGKPAPVAKPAAKAPAKAAALPNVTLRQGSRGTNVTALQTALASVYFYPDKGARNNGIDGIYGAKTADAVRRFQSVYTAHDIDGVFGPIARAALLRLIK